MSDGNKPVYSGGWHKPVHKKDWGPGWRYFQCEDCGFMWREKSRDYTSYSGSTCRHPSGDCMEFCTPVGGEPHFEWPTDQSGNLVPHSEHNVWEPTPVDGGSKVE